MLGKKLLVADDSLTIQKVIKLALSNEGYEIQTVSDGQDALQQISLFRPDVVLIDVSLPEKSAFEVKREADEQADLGSTRFILMSSAYEKVDEASYKSLNFHGRLTKPFDPAHLRKVLNETLEKAMAERTERTDLLERPVAAPPPPQAPTMIQAPSPPARPAMAPAAVAAPTLPPPVPPQPHDEDIRELTESTIKMSGLDDLQWSVQEIAAKKPEAPLAPPPPAPVVSHQEPILPPPPRMTDLGATQFSLNESANDYRSITLPDQDSSFAVETTPVPDFPPAAPEPIQYTEESLDSQGAYQASESDFSVDLGSAGADPSPPLGLETQTTVLPLTTGQMEELLKKQLQETLEAMARKMLPDIAEKIIREEIHRLLSENGER